jgi:hypothetical protein
MLATNHSNEKLSHLNKLPCDEKIKHIIHNMFVIGDQLIHMWPQSIHNSAYSTI